jgi:hypothetical protein
MGLRWGEIGLNRMKIWAGDKNLQKLKSDTAI